MSTTNPTMTTVPPEPSQRSARGAGSPSVARRLAALAVRVDRSTPAGRDRLMDALRVLSMLAVAFGHWLMAVVWVTDQGALQTDSLLALAPTSQVLTYLLQVVPLFVVVAGWSSARSLSRHTGSRAAWIHGRVRRLLLPTTAYVAVAAAATWAVDAVTDAATASLVGQAIGVHLWFTAAISLLWLVTPWLHRVWRGLGPRALVGCLVAVLTVDATVRLLGQQWVGWLNFLLVFAFCTLLGFAWHDRGIGRAVAARMTTAAGAGLAVAVASPWYPLSLVGVPGATQSNNSPLTVCIALVAVLHVGAIVLAAPALRRLLQRPPVWLAVVMASRVAVSVYLWHLLAMVVVVGFLQLVVPAALAVAPLSVGWWLSRPVWLAGLVLATAPLVGAAARLEQRPAPVDAPGRGRVVAATGLAGWGCAQVALVGPAAPAGLAAVLAAAVLGRWLPRAAPHGR